MKIAHINLAKGFRGGEKQTAILIEELSKFGYFQTLFVRNRKMNISLKRYIDIRKIKNLNIVEIGKPYIFSILKFRGFDLIHSHETKANQLSYFIYKILKIPYLITRRVQFTPSKNFFNLEIYRKAKSIISLSSAIKNDLQKLDINLKIDIIPDSTSIKILNSEWLNLAVLKNKKVIGHIGAVVDEDKGQCTILETAKLFEKERKNIHFILIGDGKDLELCKNRAKNMKNISFLGFLDEPQKYIKNFDIFIFPSNHEGLGSTLLDVMSLEVPIIASKIGGIVDIIQDGRNGFLIPPKNSQKLRDKIVELLSDNRVKNNFTENSLKIVDDFSSDKIANRYKNIYYRLIN